MPIQAVAWRALLTLSALQLSIPVPHVACQLGL